MGFAIFAHGKRYASGAICREPRGVRIFIVVLFTTFATGEHIAVSHCDTISRLREQAYRAPKVHIAFAFRRNTFTKG